MVDWNPYEIATIKAQEPCILIPISLLFVIYAELNQTRPDLAEQIKKIVKGEK
jgi:hypothetical protein